MLIHLLAETRGEDRHTVERFVAMDRPERTAEQVAAMISLMREYGSLDFAREFGLGIAAAAEDSFELAFADVPDSPERRLLHALIGWMLERDS